MAVRHETPFAILQQPPHMDDDDLDDDDEFSDANDELECESDLETSLRLCEAAMHKFLNNDFSEARDILRPWAKTSMYHALGIAIFDFIPALLTFDQAQIHLAGVALKKAIKLCNQHRRSTTLVDTILLRHDYRAYTDTEAHAELVHGEALLLQAILSFIEDEDLAALIRGTFKIKSCYNSYKVANKVMAHKVWSSEVCKRHFESGVKMGIGTFNLMISMLPSKIITLLEFVGFQGNKTEGLRLLESGSSTPGLRQQLCQLVVLSYHLIICHHNGKIGDIRASSNIIQDQLRVHPRGVWFLLFKGRLDFMSGRYADATLGYHAAIESQNEWKQIHHMCYWELMWLHSLKRDWRGASAYAARLASDSAWSRTIYSYLCAAMLLQDAKLTDSDKQSALQHIQSAPSHQQRIAGKSLPMEKFVIRRCRRFAAQSNNLLLPALEMMCLWNVFETLQHNIDAGHDILDMTQSAISSLQSGSPEWEGGFRVDNLALVYYVHGTCLRHVGELALAVRALDRAISYKDRIKEDHFIVPYATVELAFCMFSLGDSERGIQHLNDAKSKYKGYSLESRLQFRIHNKLQEESDKSGKTTTRL